MTPEPDRADAFVAAAPAAVGNAGAPALRLGAWEGPLDLLLELARAQRVDLAQLSIATLAEQFAAAVDVAIACRQVPLSRLAEWHIMAAWLTLLRTRLLLPELPDDTAQAEVAGLRQRLADRDAARRLADWLERRPQLGREIFARGAPEPAADAQPAADLTALLRACLTVLELPARERVYRPNPPPLWRVPDALAHMRRLLAALPQGAALEAFLPTGGGQGPFACLQRRAALASTLVAGLELSRDGAAVLDQDTTFGEVRVKPVGPASEDRSRPGVAAA
jgi:segregation and condensation protein A